MRKLPVFVLALLLGLAAVGCDSNEDDESDADRIMGTWNLVSIADDVEDQTAGFAGLANGLKVTFNGDGTFILNLDYKDDSGRDDVQLPGTYSINESSQELTLSVPILQSELLFDYDFDSDDQISLSAAAPFINAVFNPTTDYVGTVDIVVRRD